MLTRSTSTLSKLRSGRACNTHRLWMLTWRVMIKEDWVRWLISRILRALQLEELVVICKAPARKATTLVNLTRPMVRTTQVLIILSREEIKGTTQKPVILFKILQVLLSVIWLEFHRWILSNHYKTLQVPKPDLLPITGTTSTQDSLISSWKVLL